jgi:RNA polymerase sigma-70 factor, ECF subfamily
MSGLVSLMDSFVTFRLPGFGLSEESKVAENSAAQCTAETAISDEVLMVQICQGNREALASLFRRYAHVVRSVCYRVLRDQSEAEDLMQDVFLLVNRDSKSFDGSKGPAKFWILQMAYRRAISRRRYLTSRHFYTRIDPEDAATELADEEKGRFEDSIDGMLGKGSLQRVFDSLSEDQRQTLQLHFVEGYSFDEIAGKMGQSRGNIKHHYFRGLEKLRKEFFVGKLPRERAL